LAQHAPTTEGKPTQQPPAKDGPPAQKDKELTLAEMLEAALKDNPDIRVAEAKRQEADAVLNKTRLQVMQQVVALNAALKEAKAGVATAERQLVRLHDLQGKNAVPLVSTQEVQNAEAALLTAKAALEKAEADLALVLGKQPGKGVAALTFSPDGKLLYTQSLDYTIRLWDARTGKLLAPPPPVTGTVAERLRKALETQVKVDYKDVPFAEVLKDLEKQAPGVTFHNQLVDRYKDGNPRTTLQFKEPLPLRAALQALEDNFESGNIGRLAFVVREYGILVTPLQFVPPGAVQVDEFKSGEQPKGPGPSGPRNPPPGPIEGTIKEVDASAGLATVSVGSDAGLARGQTLEVYRLNPPKYVGTLRLIEVRPQEAVGKMEGKHAEVQASDLVTSKIVGQ
jgi:hypothetical protein